MNTEKQNSISFSDLSENLLSISTEAFFNNLSSPCSSPILMFEALSSSELKLFSAFLPDLRFLFSLSTSLIRSTKPSCGTLSISESSFIVLIASFDFLTKFDPVIASILLTPDDTEVSLDIINPSISDVFFTWVPPHNSTEKSPPRLTTLTSSPYLSSAKANAPESIAP